MGQRRRVDTPPEQVMRPLLRYWQVAGRGALYGLAATALEGLIALFLDYSRREDFLTYAVVLAAMCAFGVLFGSLHWSADVRRWRDRHTLNPHDLHAHFSVSAPLLVRIGYLGLALLPGSFLLLTLEHMDIFPDLAQFFGP